MCHRCAASGSWYDLKRRAGNGTSFQLVGTPDAPNSTRPKDPSSAGRREEALLAQQRAAGLQPVPDQQRVRSYPANLMSNPRFAHVRDYLTGKQPGQRGIRIEVLIKYGVGCAAYR